MIQRVRGVLAVVGSTPSGSIVQAPPWHTGAATWNATVSAKALLKHDFSMDWEVRAHLRRGLAALTAATSAPRLKGLTPPASAPGLTGCGGSASAFERDGAKLCDQTVRGAAGRATAYAPYSGHTHTHTHTHTQQTHTHADTHAYADTHTHARTHARANNRARESSRSAAAARFQQRPRAGGRTCGRHRCPRHARPMGAARRRCTMLLF